VDVNVVESVTQTDNNGIFGYSALMLRGTKKVEYNAFRVGSTFVYLDHVSSRLQLRATVNGDSRLPEVGSGCPTYEAVFNYASSDVFLCGDAMEACFVISGIGSKRIPLQKCC